MTRLLLLDTSTERGVFALSDQGTIILEEFLPVGFQTAQHLLPSIQKALSSLQLSPKDIEAVAAGAGPGSYTGIRVGAMVAKTVAFALHIPLIGVSTLKLLVEGEGSAAILDAKIGGFYVQFPDEEPKLIPQEELVYSLINVNKLISTSLQIREKVEALCGRQFAWQERAPSMQALAFLAEEQLSKGAVEPFTILYLRKTQAEINRITLD